MRKILIPIALLLLAAVGCNRTKTTSNEVDINPFTLSDSIFIESEFGDDYSHYTMNIDLPVTDNDTLRQNILKWILSDNTDDYEIPSSKAIIPFPSKPTCMSPTLRKAMPTRAARIPYRGTMASLSAKQTAASWVTTFLRTPNN